MEVRKTKVFHIITLLELGGAQRNTLFTVANLNREKFDVGLVAGYGALLDYEAKKISGLKLYFVPYLVRQISPIKDFLAIFRLVQILRRERPDIVHTHSSKAGILGRLAAWVSGIPCIIHSIHGFGFNPYQKFYVRFLFILLEKWMAYVTHRFIAVTKENIEEGVRLGIGKISQYVLIRSGVNIEEIKRISRETDIALLKNKMGIPASSKIVLTVGPFKIQKNPVGFVRLANSVAERIPQTHFLMAGDGELREKVEEEIRRSKLGDRVRLLGWRKDVPELLALCDIFVLTSLWEGLPRAAVEALIVGKPVCAFAVDGLKEIVRDGENGYLVPPNDTVALAQKVVGVFQNESMAKRLSDNASKSIDASFDIYELVRQQEELYCKMADEKLSECSCRIDNM